MPHEDKEYDEPASDRTIGRDWKKGPAIAELSDVPALTEEQLMLCASTVKGYSLRNKRWLDFFVDSLKDIGWKDSAMSDVVLGTEQRQLVYSVVKNYTERTVPNTGMNFLISGDSGVGKTMAVEAAAECLHAPVFHLTNADIELEPDNPDLENPFTDILEMCTNWKAVILYDSADKTLDRDCTDDPENEESVDLVSFLHALESHFSLLFVTTTLEISPAYISPRLLSRFHFTTYIPYPDVRTRKAIWEKHLQACGVSVFANSSVLAGWVMNGREIANAVTAARMLAGGGNLTTRCLESVIPKHKLLDCESDLNDDLDDILPDDGWFDTTEKRAKKTISKKPVEDAPPLPLAAEERQYDSQEPGRSKYKENIKVTPPSLGESRTAQGLPPSPRPVEDDWAFWDIGKKGKKKTPTENIPKASGGSADDDVWDSWGTSVKSKKSTPAEPETAPAPVDLVVDKPAVAEEDSWGSFGVKKDKKKKKPAAPVEPEILPVPADPPADVEPAKLPEPAAEDPPSVDCWSFGVKKDKKKKKAAAPVEPEMSVDSPAAAAVETIDVWAFDSSKKDKKKKKRATPVEQETVADAVPAETVVNPMPAVSSNEGWGSFWGQGK